MSLFDLAGKTALVTGASSGLGAHFARVLGEAGARVALLARHRARLEAEVETLRADGITAAGYVADVTERAGLSAAIDAAEADLGGLDILVNNAGVARTERFLEMSEEAWQTVLDVNLSGVWRTAQLVAKRMKARGAGGSIIQIASILGTLAQPTQANYAASKAGVLQLTRVMARELGRDGIRVNALAPGYFETEINAEFFASEAGQKLLGRLFPRRLGELRELDGPLLLLASSAGRFITGERITVDGGAQLMGV
jgi:NAD(P)-dependent dehydrogenase (short-subunit alcohol dehydrogenase family)